MSNATREKEGKRKKKGTWKNGVREPNDAQIVVPITRTDTSKKGQKKAHPPFKLKKNTKGEIATKKVAGSSLPRHVQELQSSEKEKKTRIFAILLGGGRG